MHLLELLVTSLLGLMVAMYLVAHSPIHRALRWKGDMTTEGRDIAPTAEGEVRGIYG